MTLRPYQIEAWAATVHALDRHERVLLVLATGLGKTHVFSRIAADWTEGRVLVLAHREELLEQACKKLYDATGEWPDVEKGDRYSNELSEKHRKQFVVASVQSLHQNRLTGERFRDIGLVVCDEAHHASEDSSQWGDILNHLWDKNTKVRVLGVTATPERHDGKRLLFDHFSYTYSIKDAVEDGWLVRPMSTIVLIDSLDLSHVRDGKHDLNQTELHEELEREGPLQEIALATIAEAGDRKTLLFAPSVKAAERIWEIIDRERPGSAEWITGNRKKFPTERRKEIFQDFADRKFQFLINMAVASEGFDDPGIEMLAMARPTKSLTLYSQQIGRGTRTLPGTVDGLATAEERKAAIAASAKPYIKVLDFVDNSRRSLITAVDPRVLGGRYEPNDELDQAVVERAKRNIEQRTRDGEVCDIDRELILARRQEIEEREAEDRRRRAGLNGRVKYHTILVDPLNPNEIVQVSGDAPTVKQPRGAPPTVQQAKFLSYHGFNPNEYNKRSAGLMIGKIKSGEIKSKRGQQTIASVSDDQSDWDYSPPADAYQNIRRPTSSVRQPMNQQAMFGDP